MVSYVEFEEFLLIAYENVKEGLGLPSVLSLENSKSDNPISSSYWLDIWNTHRISECGFKPR